MRVGSGSCASLRGRRIAGFIVIAIAAAVPARGQSTTLPSPQRSQDIGAPRLAGTASYDAGTYSIQGSGADIGGTADQFQFVFQPIVGDFDVSMHVGSIAARSVWAKVGVMVREALTPDSTHAFALLTAHRGYAFERRALTGGTTDMTATGTGLPPGWVRLVRTGSQFDAYRSDDGTTWTPMGTDVIQMPDSVYVGIAVTSRSSQSMTTAVLDSFVLKQATSPTNLPPIVSLTAPPDGASFTAPAAITLSADAHDPEGRLDHVDFFSGTAKLGTAATAPYSTTWPSVPAGTYTLTAVAYDADGGQATSPAVTVQVTGANAPPTVALTSPANGTTYTAPATVSLAANAADADGTIAKVEFYQGPTLLGTATAAPYAWTWPSVPAGTYALTAIAYDNAGAKTTSAAVSVTVNAVVSPPRAVQFQASADNTLVTSYRFDVFANGADPTTATPVASVDLGKPAADVNGDITVDESAFFNALAPGTYAATVTAIGTRGTARSTAVTFTR